MLIECLPLRHVADVLELCNIVLLCPKVVLSCSVMGHRWDSCTSHLSLHNLTGCAT